MRYAYKHLTGSQVISPSPTTVVSVAVTSDGGGVADITLYNGESTNDDRLIKLKAGNDSTRSIRFSFGLYLSKGLYVDVGSNVESVLIVYDSQPE